MRKLKVAFCQSFTFMFQFVTCALVPGLCVLLWLLSLPLSLSVHCAGLCDMVTGIPPVPCCVGACRTHALLLISGACAHRQATRPSCVCVSSELSVTLSNRVFVVNLAPKAQ